MMDGGSGTMVARPPPSLAPPQGRPMPGRYFSKPAHVNELLDQDSGLPPPVSHGPPFALGRPGAHLAPPPPASQRPSLGPPPAAAVDAASTVLRISTPQQEATRSRLCLLPAPPVAPPPPEPNQYHHQQHDGSDLLILPLSPVRSGRFSDVGSCNDGVYDDDDASDVSGRAVGRGVGGGHQQSGAPPPARPVPLQALMGGFGNNQVHRQQSDVLVLQEISDLVDPRHAPPPPQKPREASARHSWSGGRDGQLLLQQQPAAAPRQPYFGGDKLKQPSTVTPLGKAYWTSKVVSTLNEFTASRAARAAVGPQQPPPPTDVRLAGKHLPRSSDDQSSNGFDGFSSSEYHASTAAAPTNGGFRERHTHPALAPTVSALTRENLAALQHLHDEQAAAAAGGGGGRPQLQRFASIPRRAGNDDGAQALPASLSTPTSPSGPAAPIGARHPGPALQRLADINRDLPAPLSSGLIPSASGGSGAGGGGARFNDLDAARKMAIMANRQKNYAEWDQIVPPVVPPAPPALSPGQRRQALLGGVSSRAQQPARVAAARPMKHASLPILGKPRAAAANGGAGGARAGQRRGGYASSSSASSASYESDAKVY